MAAAQVELASLVKQFPVWHSHLVPDFVIFNLALDVLEHARAVVILTDHGLGRPAIANSRSAFEAALDMLLLIAQPDQYNQLGALARACELVDTEQLHARRAKADAAIQFSRDVKVASPEAIVAEEADAWEEYLPGASRLLHDALARVRREKLWRRHWSGLDQKERRERIAAVATDSTGIVEMIDAMYGIQSAHAHPGPRSGARDRVIGPDGTLTIGPREVDVPAARGFTTLALQVAAIALNRRPEPPQRDEEHRVSVVAV